jgi:hypothetical protein
MGIAAERRRKEKRPPTARLQCRTWQRRYPVLANPEDFRPPVWADNPLKPLVLAKGGAEREIMGPTSLQGLEISRCLECPDKGWESTGEYVGCVQVARVGPNNGCESIGCPNKGWESKVSTERAGLHSTPMTHRGLP